MSASLPPGTAPVKAEYLISAKPIAVPDDDAAEGGAGHAPDTAERDDRDRGDRGDRGGKKKGKDKSKRGANKGRRFAKMHDEVEVCWKTANGETCEFGERCKFTHDIAAYLAAKPHDLRIPQTSEISTEAPFYVPPPLVVADPENPSLDPHTRCPIFDTMGVCKSGLKCRLLGAHVRKNDDGSLYKNEAGLLELVTDEEKRARTVISETELNYLHPEVRTKLFKKRYEYPITDAYLKDLESKKVVIAEPEQEEPGWAGKADETDASTTAASASDGPTTSTETPAVPTLEVPAVPTPNAPVAPSADALITQRTGADPSQLDEPMAVDVPFRAEEKKRLHWEGKTYLAPLTTVGNLPFRRICVDYGVDITCGEMGLATSFLSGSKEEWSLVRRHPSEKMFGVQMAGNKPNTMVRAAELLKNEIGPHVDFVDINCGCPIDLVYKTGSGSALLDSPGKLGRIIVGMNKALGDTPVSVKLRTGVKDGKNNAHRLMPRVAEWGAGMMTLHGRTRQQRYTKLADWDYVRECVQAVRAYEAEKNLPKVPIFGGGDCYSSQDYWTDVETTGVDGVMIGRGALIKPWIFTEIKERREWDISSRERLEHVRKFVEYGLNHFGADTPGVNTTRRYLCEALSFQYRYIPIGLLERLPGKLNERAPAFKGRDDLETLLASPDSRDWVKISEMFLGPAPDAWSFMPKHKSNAYESQG
ncbi:FMN-linked oxidoreductase [Schizophyllum commune H4-8]|uniref:tRNA-dihydrouridine(47) synthase [NAD(P)(+)] n=1 Tax=Schizophyllum commune (strain H4-8 / FGSC 9210) TaxID=578458 RepID=D8Q8C9_SCHCM|nr:FMN-linked oxidoreductase [Schizophyllum commune H4-8]KAI5891104.1 FMN-linked oxidoreductase [Schizophyllum commune H4-8]